MEFQLLIPYDNITSDFDCDFEIDEKTYMQMLNNSLQETNQIMNGVVVTNNPHNQYIQNTINTENNYYHAPCILKDINNKDVGINDLSRYLQLNDLFILTVNINEEIDNQDVESELKYWINTSNSILNLTNLNDDEKFRHLPTKNFKIKNNNLLWSIEDCRIVDIDNINNFSIIINKIKN